MVHTDYAFASESGKGKIGAMALSQDLKAKRLSADETYEAILAAEQSRATHLLATMIVDPIAPEMSIGDLEAIGIEKRKQIIAWIQEAKDNEKSKAQ